MVEGAVPGLAHRAGPSDPSGSSGLIASQSPADSALDAMKQLCLCAATSFTVGPGEGAREWVGLRF